MLQCHWYMLKTWCSASMNYACILSQSCSSSDLPVCVCVKGFPEKDITKLEDYGFIASRPRGEYHANNQQMAKLLHKAIGLGGKKAAPMVCLPSSPSLLVSLSILVPWSPPPLFCSCLQAVHVCLLHGTLASVPISQSQFWCGKNVARYAPVPLSFVIHFCIPCVFSSLVCKLCMYCGMTLSSYISAMS